MSTVTTGSSSGKWEEETTDSDQLFFVTSYRYEMRTAAEETKLFDSLSFIAGCDGDCFLTLQSRLQ